MTAAAARMIRLRGKWALSTGIAMGAKFPAVGGWTFEIPQPPAGEPPNAFVFMSPPSQGAQSIGGAEDACAMVQAVRDKLGEILKTRQLQATRLFFYGPFALAVFLGQQLTSIGKMQLFEYQDPGYVPSCLLRT